MHNRSAVEKNDLMRRRILAVQQLIVDRGGDALVTMHAANVRYLTGFYGVSDAEREALVFVPAKGNTKLLVPIMYSEKAKMLDVVLQNKIELIVDVDRIGLHALLANVLKDETPRVLLVEEHDLSVLEWKRIGGKSGIKLSDGGRLIERCRMIKDEYELTCIQKAIEITKELFQLVEKNVLTNTSSFTEISAANFLQSEAIRLGADGMAFPPIVASGIGTSHPHYVPQHIQLPKNGIVLVDVGATYRGYCGDMTRCFFIGKVEESYRTAYKKIQRIQSACAAAVRAGVTGKQLYNTLQQSFMYEGLEQKMPHSLGHGIGLEIHEDPLLRPLEDQILLNNTVVTIEPGYYEAGKFGVRYEDAIVVRSTE
ncbi:MAG TPA: Xaa-Pro peptidase family protein [Patescibacteria group bacterium]|nr:Xaa-Pro peptidase family protein [Patescibacteria group bacterium]